MSGVSREDHVEFQAYITKCTDDQLNAAWWVEHRGRNRRFERICMMEAVKRGHTLIKPDVYETRRTKTVPAKEPTTTLAERLQDVLSCIPVEEQLRGLSLISLQERFTGRWRGKCHPGELGEALRELGWGRHRVWDNKGTETFAALWYPPTAHEDRRQMKDVADTRAFITNIQKELSNG